MKIALNKITHSHICLAYHKKIIPQFTVDYNIPATKSVAQIRP